MTRYHRHVAALITVSILIAGCADDAEPDTAPTATSEPADTTQSSATPAPDNDNPVPDDTVPEDTIPEDTVPNDDNPVPDDTIPDDTIPDDTIPEEGTRTNELGEPVTLDQGGDLACANAEFAQDSLLTGDTEQAQADVDAAAQRATESSVPAMATAGPAIAEALTTSDPIGAVQAFAVCTDHGYEL